MLLEDREIIELYNARSETAIVRTAEKYGSYCRSVAFHILASDEDAEECVNDTWMQAWNSIPPQCPRCLRLFLGKITRNLSLSIADKRRTEKRGGGKLPLLLDELAECLPARDNAETATDEIIIRDTLDRFLDGLSPQDKWLFLRRYWHTDSVEELACELKVRENHVYVRLHRLRKKLKDELEKEGICV